MQPCADEHNKECNRVPYYVNAGAEVAHGYIQIKVQYVKPCVPFITVERCGRRYLMKLLCLTLLMPQRSEIVHERGKAT